MSLKDDLTAAQAEVARIETALAALPQGLLDKAEADMVELFHGIAAYFKGDVPPKQ